VEPVSQRTNGAHRRWDLPESAVTPEACYLQRREFLRVFGLGVSILGAIAIPP